MLLIIPFILFLGACGKDAPTSFISIPAQPQAPSPSEAMSSAPRQPAATAPEIQIIPESKKVKELPEPTTIDYSLIPENTVPDLIPNVQRFIDVAIEEGVEPKKLKGFGYIVAIRHDEAGLDALPNTRNPIGFVRVEHADWFKREFELSVNIRTAYIRMRYPKAEVAQRLELCTMFHELGHAMGWAHVEEEEKLMSPRLARKGDCEDLLREAFASEFDVLYPGWYLTDDVRKPTECDGYHLGEDGI